ncbi:hypothetical protein, partial [Candidatus Amarolinea dominans]|uniref:hypothetical protein n=1 Tax=Candidatus Amarolinea dominans TaxID=3140696 RepID=UPI001DC2228D|nr:hypothetical protein [Anaerolineae bacterium]
MPASAWAEVAILAESFLADPRPALRITWHNDSSGANAAFYLDDVRLTAPDPARRRNDHSRRAGVRRLPARPAAATHAYWNGSFVHADADLVAESGGPAASPCCATTAAAAPTEITARAVGSGAANNAWAMNT